MRIIKNIVLWIIGVIVFMAALGSIIGPPTRTTSFERDYEKPGRHLEATALVCKSEPEFLELNKMIATDKAAGETLFIRQAVRGRCRRLDPSDMVVVDQIGRFTARVRRQGDPDYYWVGVNWLAK